MIKAIFFDVGGCYLKGSFISFVNKSYKVLGIDDTYFHDKEIIFDPEYNTGKITADECFKKYFQVPISDEQLKKIKQLWTTTWVLQDDMKELVEGLKKNNYKLAILSNSDLLNSNGYTEKGWYSYFDPLILSHEVGFAKPAQEIYDVALEKIETPAKECLFIDDQEDVLVPARNMGMKTILYKSVDQLKEELDKLDINFK